MIPPGGTATASPPALPAIDEQRVLDVVRQLARESGGVRAAEAVTPTASLEREVGLGSLERVELGLRLEAALGRDIGDRFLLLDTPREIVRALADAPALARLTPAAPAPAQAASLLRMEDIATLPAALERRAGAEPTRVHVHLYEDAASRPITYGELHDGAARIAGALHARGVRRGHTVAIMLPTGQDFLETFMGVLAAGAAAVPLYPPVRLDRLAEYLQRQARILANSDARLLIAMPEARPVARLLRDAAPALEAIVTADALRDAGGPLTESVAVASDLALIQYTSGSTGDPKGVALTHANLLSNIRAIAAGLEIRGTDVGVSWLPLYHDMGLIGTWLNSMVQGIPLGLLSPLAFLARPERWLWAIHERRATLSAAPNFAFELCVRKVRDEAIEGLDLSSWRCALNGSEPVSPGTLERFATRFARYGFVREALMPVYGLAESSVALCIPPLRRGPRVDRVAREPFAREGRAAAAAPDDAHALEFASVGRPLAGHEVRLVDDAGAAVADRVVGRLLFRGPSCMAAYHRNPEATARTLLPGGWLDSGDLAYRADGELYITGRRKDLIIKGGRNLVPQEIEEMAGAVPGIRAGCVAAFGVPDEASGTERLVVLAETRLEDDAERHRLEAAVIAAVGAAVGLPPDEVRILPPGSVPKTPSGKIRRGEARALYEAGRLAATRRLPLAVRAGLALQWAGGGLRTLGHRAARIAYLAYLTVVGGGAALLAAPVLAVLVRLLPRGRPVRRLSRLVARAALRITGCRVVVEGAERIPRAGPLVLVANHTSYADTPVLVAALPLDFVMVTMAEIESWLLVGTFARRADHPMVERFQAQRSLEAQRAIQDRLRGGECVLFFPEGTVSPASGLRPFRLGAFEAALATGAPVLPIALRGTRRALRIGTRFPRPGRIHVWIGEPIAPTGAGWEGTLALRDRAVEAIAAHCGEPRLDLVYGRT